MPARKQGPGRRSQASSEAAEKVLILVKHSLPEMDPRLPANQWQLSEEGRRRCKRLAEHLKAYAPEAMVCSPEPKAVETARLTAEGLGLSYEIQAGLQEHRRSQVGLMERSQFEAEIQRLFALPDQRVIGEETADEAHRRFTAAVESALRRYPARNLVIVAHGTVISLYASRAYGLEAYPLWQQLGMPAFIVLSRPPLARVEKIQSIL